MPELQSESLREVQDIRNLMERSSRFISLSGLSGVAAGIIALIGAFIAKGYLEDFNEQMRISVDRIAVENKLIIRLSLLALAVFGLALVSSSIFTLRRIRKHKVKLWNPVSKRLFWNMMIPLVAGGLFCLGMLQYNIWGFVAPACLVFYGLALVNASKYTLSDIRYLGYCEIVLGLLNMQWIGYGLYFWAVGFGVLHIIYGIIMWWKYEREPEQ